MVAVPIYTLPPRRAVFVPDNVIKNMNRKKILVAPFFYTGIFRRKRRIEDECPMLIFRYGNIDVYKCYHFSDSRGRTQLERMRELIIDYIDDDLCI